MARLEALKARVEAAVNASPKLAPMKSQIRLDMTPDGLRIQIVDEQNRPMFDSGSAVVKPYMRELLREIGHMLTDVPNRITLEGHTDAAPFSGGERGYSNWELSSDRANASRREIVAGGLPEDRMLRVQGLAVEQAVRAGTARASDEPAHQRHRHEPRGRGPAAEAPAQPGRSRDRCRRSAPTPRPRRSSPPAAEPDSRGRAAHAAARRGRAAPISAAGPCRRRGSRRSTGRRRRSPTWAMPPDSSATMIVLPLLWR